MIRSKNRGPLNNLLLKNHDILLMLVSNLKTQTNSVFLNPNINNTESSESVPPTEDTEVSLPIVSTLTRCMNPALQVPTRNIRSTSDVNKHPNTSEKCTSQRSLFGATSHQFQFQKTATVHFLQFDRTQRNIITARQKRSFITDAIRFTKKSV